VKPLTRAWFQQKQAQRALASEGALDTEALLATIDKALHPKQRAFVYDKHRRVSAKVGARGGKSTGGRARFLYRMLTTHRARCLFIAPKLHQSKKILWEPFKDMLNKLGIPFKSTESISELKITLLHNGATLELGGAATKSDIDRYRGLAFHEIGIDECASFRPGLLERLVDRVLSARLGDYRGTLWLISTPGLQRGLFYEVNRAGSKIGTPFEEQDGAPEGYSTHHWSLKDGAPYVTALKNAWDEALDTKKRNDWSDDHPVWQREYLGNDANDDTENIYKYRPHVDGKDYNQWDPEKDENGFATLPDHLQGHTIFYSYGIDPGIRDPFGLIIWAWSPHDPTKTLYHVYEFAKKGMYAETTATLFLGPTPEGTEPRNRLKSPKGLIGKTGWPAVKVADKQNNLALFEELANVYGLYFKKAEKRDKHSAQELFNGDLLAGRIKVIKGSEYELQLQTLQYVTDELGGIEEDTAARNDLSDAGLYARTEAHHLHSSSPPPKEPYFQPPSNDDDSDDDSDDYDEGALFFEDNYYDSL